ncbi:MAG: hypothetical protein E6I97_25215 [Chloroflexi bacterium]|nr:MAG: hypothetical protein E6I97_25215 [Chloroflexota bacterium]
MQRTSDRCATGRYPGYLALELGSTISSPLARVLADLQQGTQARLDALLAAYWPHSTPEQRHLPLLVSYRLFLALLPLALSAAATRIVPAGGRTSQEMWTHHSAEALADRLGRAFVEFPGGHNGPMLHPRAFAQRLRDVLGDEQGT